jgi:GAF domain-containing protein
VALRHTSTTMSVRRTHAAMPHNPGMAHPNRLLELLATDASHEQLERAARQLGVSADDAELARRVRATLDQQRRRETELAALVETARDLAVLRDLDAVLVAIVRRARTLLGTDTAYLTLVDDECGDTFMRVTDGSVSARFQRLRLPRGAGLGGLVALTGAPYATADYLRDERFEHTSEIDRGVLDEGLVAILGVPLAMGGRVIGVLFAANRRRRPFAREEVDLLGSLAALAAVAIDNARLLAETRQAVADARAANELARQHSMQVERAADAHERLTALVLRGGDVPELAAAVVEVLDGGLLVLDAARRELAAVGVPAPLPHGGASGGGSGGASGVGSVVRGLDDVLATARRSAGCVTVAESPLGPCTVAAVLAGGDPLGYLVLHGRPLRDGVLRDGVLRDGVLRDGALGDGVLGGGERRILERAAQVTALLLLLRRARAEAENRLRGELLTDLLAAPGRDPDRLRERARRLPLDLDADHVVVAAAADAVGRHRLASAAAGIAADRHGLAGEYQGVVVLLVPARTPGEAAGLVRGRLAAAVRAKVTAGAAGPARGPAGIADAYGQARRCLDALRALGRTGDAACPADLGFAGLLLAQADGEAVGRFVDDTVGPVLRYDAHRGTELTATLQAYFAHDRSPARCAVPLHVHVNTVAQRLDRVRQLLGDSWTDPERALQIQLALHLHRLRT